MIDPRPRLIASKLVFWNKRNGQYLQSGACETRDIYATPGVTIPLGDTAITVTAVSEQCVTFSDGQTLQPGQTVKFSSIKAQGLSTEERQELSLTWVVATSDDDNKCMSDSVFTNGELRRAVSLILGFGWEDYLEALRQNISQWFPGNPPLRIGLEMGFVTPNVAPVSSVFDEKTISETLTDQHLSLALPSGRGHSWHVTTYYEDGLAEMPQKLSADITKGVKRAYMNLLKANRLVIWPKVSFAKPVSRKGRMAFKEFAAANSFSVTLATVKPPKQNPKA